MTLGAATALEAGEHATSEVDRLVIQFPPLQVDDRHPLGDAAVGPEAVDHVALDLPGRSL